MQADDESTHAVTPVAKPLASSETAFLGKMVMHPLREKLYNELHTRPFHLLGSPAQITHIAIQHQGKLAVQEHAFIALLCDRFQVSSPTSTMSCFYQDYGLFSLRWERHMEYSTYTIIHEAPIAGELFSKNAIDFVPSDWLEHMPGEVIAAMHLVVESQQQSNPIEQYFDNMRLIASAPMNGLAKVWSSFKLHDDGFARMLVHAPSLSPEELGRLVQRLLQLDSYRLMATLGLPMAQAINGELNKLDLQLQQVTKCIAVSDKNIDDRKLLAQVSAIAAKVEDFRAQSNYRFAATNAYYDVVLQRMDELKEDELLGYMTLQEFLMRRISPAIKTCQTVAKHLEDISRRVTRASDLLRTRVEMMLQEQNQELLKSMNRRAHVQMRLQQTVEGLSVAAISYYAMQLLETVLSSISAVGVSFNHDLVSGIAVPVVITTVFIGTRYIHRRLMRSLE